MLRKIFVDNNMSYGFALTILLEAQ